MDLKSDTFCPLMATLKDGEPLLGREEELKELRDFTTAKGEGFVYVRGRRRVGKSRLLKELADTNKSVFYFHGSKDSHTAKTLADYASAWDSFTKKTRLSELRSTSLTWTRIFQEISEHVRQSRKPVVLIFDEIQWIASTQSGCVGAIKEAWLDWERLGVKVIICGSSNRFFSKQTGGEEKILRGLATRSPIWIEPFTLRQVKKLYFSKWTNEEVALTYMMLGGVPYYLKSLLKQDPDRGFAHCLNDAVFRKQTIFLEEINEIVGLEFNRRGVETVKKILSALGQDGKTLAEIQKQTGIPKTTIVDRLDSLLEYKLVFKKSPAHEQHANEAGARYFMKDFYLNFYFQVLVRNKFQIESNSKGFLFGSVFEQNSNYFIRDFSGKAFELITRVTLEDRLNRAPKVFHLLDLKDGNYEVLDYWRARETQIDLLVEHNTDRLSRIIECKWIGANNKLLADYVDEVLEKKYEPPKTYSRKHILVVSRGVSVGEMQRAKSKGVTIVTLDDLF